MEGPLTVHAGGSGTLLPEGFRWPGGKRLAVLFRMAFERCMEIATAADDVWIGTRGEAAAHVHTAPGR